MSTDEHQQPGNQPSKPSEGQGGSDKPRMAPHEYEAETFIGYTKPPAHPAKPHDPDATIGPQRASNPPAPPGKPGAWSGAKSNIFGHANKPGGGAQPQQPAQGTPTTKPGATGGSVSDSWDQSANATQATIASGRSPSGFGTAKTLDRGRIGPYPLERELGRGGMGVVYLARDEKLGRLVAVKVLPDMFAQHPERAARFEREARLLASLNHPNIASIYELGEESGARYLTLEYVPGLTLSERLAAGQVPMDEAMHICAQIAEGLEAAHEKGVIHRDLKPGNVKITPEGIVKVLDFGLAKASGPDGSGEEASPDMPTGSLGNTQEGMILGTAGYMSPEQARGRALDKRTDVWSFGCVLYETLTGRSPFYADTVSDTIALILRTDPDWTVLPPETPERVRELLRRCFIKDPKRRLRDLGEARIELQAVHQQLSSFGGSVSASAIANPSAFNQPSTQPMTTSKPAQPAAWWQYVPWAMAGLAVAVAAMVTAALFLKPDGVSGQRGVGGGIGGVVRFSVSLPSGIEPLPRGVVPLLAVSPDEQWVVVSAEQEGRRRLYARGLDGMNFGPVGQIVGATAPFFSPDSGQLGFVRGTVIERVSVTGLRTVGGNATPTTVVEGIAGEVAGATWTEGGEIVYAVASGNERGLFRAAADQRTRGQVLLAAAPGEEYLWPHAVLRAGVGDLLVYTVRRGGAMSVRWLSMADPSRGGELGTGGAASVVGRGNTRYLVYGVGDGLEATAIQISASGITNLGGVQSLQRGIAFSPDSATHFALSDDGLLAFLPDAERPRRMQVAPLREGASPHAELLSATGVGGDVRVDPLNPQRMAFLTNEDAAPVRVLTVGQPPVDLTTISGRVTSMAWRPRPGSAGSVLTMTVQTSDRTGIFEWDESSGSIEEVSLGRISMPLVHAWDRRGQSLFLSSETSTGTRELRRSATGTTVQLPTAEGVYVDVVPSPDSTYFAYTRMVSGVSTVHLRSNTESGTSFAVPGGPSWAPLWIPVDGASGVGGGGTLFFQRIDGLHAIEITEDPQAPLGDTRLVASFQGVPGSTREYDAAGDGSWVIVPVIERGQGGEVRVVVNFNAHIAYSTSNSP